MLLTVTLKGGGILCTLFLGKHITPFISHPGVGLPTNKFNHTFPNQEKKTPVFTPPTNKNPLLTLPVEKSKPSTYIRNQGKKRSPASYSLKG